MTDHYLTIVCAACRASVLLQVGATLTLPWRNVYEDYPRGWFFCSDECQARGPAKPVREAVPAFFDFDRKTTPAFRVGAADALGGFDALSQDPEYLKGHAAGMEVRQMAETMGGANAQR